MIGDKVYKPIDTQAQCDKYSALAKWCNENDCHIEDKGDYYEVVKTPAPEPMPIEPSQLDIIEAQVMYTALMTDTLIESEV